MAFQRFELTRNHRGTTVATIDPQGRLFIPTVVKTLANLEDGQHVELYYDPQDRMIGLVRVESETIFSLPIKVHSVRSDMLRVSVMSLLKAYGIFIPKRIRGRMAVAPDGMIVFAFDESRIVELGQSIAVKANVLSALIPDFAEPADLTTPNTDDAEGTVPTGTTSNVSVPKAKSGD